MGMIIFFRLSFFRLHCGVRTMPGEEDEQQTSDLQDTIAQEVGRQLAFILPEALRQLLEQHPQPPGLAQVAESSQSCPLKLPLTEEVTAQALREVPFPTELEVKDARKKAKKLNKDMEYVVFSPEPSGKDNAYLHQAITPLIAWKKRVARRGDIAQADVGPLFEALDALEKTWRQQANIAFASSIPGSTDKTSRKEVMLCMNLTNGDPFKALDKIKETHDRRATTKATIQSAKALQIFQQTLRAAHQDQIPMSPSSSSGRRTGNPRQGDKAGKTPGARDAAPGAGQDN